MPVVVDDWLGRASPSQRDSVDGCSRYLQAMGIVIAPDIHPPTQEATAVKLWRNAQRVSSEALAKEDALRRVPPRTQ
jgi:hypothetical protein